MFAKSLFLKYSNVLSSSIFLKNLNFSIITKILEILVSKRQLGQFSAIADSNGVSIGRIIEILSDFIKKKKKKMVRNI